MNKQVYIYYDPQNPEFCKKMTAKYGEDWNLDDFENDTSDDFILLETVQKLSHTGLHFGVISFIILIVTQTTPMRKIEEQMNMAIRARKSWAGSNTTVRAYNDSIDVYLHGHCIAWLDVINNVWTLSSCGWETVTTKSRLNALMSEFGLGGIFQKNYQWFHARDGKTVPFVDGVKVK